MPGMCSVPGCKGYKKARSRGVVFHSLPTRDPGRCREWLKAIQNPKFDENTPVSKYGNIRVCSQHFKPEDYEPDIQAELMKTTPRKILKSFTIPSVFSGRQQEDLSTSLPAHDSSQTQAPSTGAQASTSLVSGSSVDSVLQRASVLTSGPSTSSQASSVTVHVTDVDTATLSSSLPTPVDSGARSTSSMSPPSSEVSESLSSVASEDHLSESFHQETELNSTATSNLDKNTEKDLSQSKTIVNDSCLMELFKKCQTCGQPITKKKVSHCGAQKKVRWSCLGGHRGLWMSSPHLWEAFPEIHLLTALSVLFSGGAFTHFKKWAKHLQLNFMGHKTFFEIQKAYLNPEMKQMNRTEQEKIFEKGVCQVPEGTLHISDPLKKIKTKSKRRDKGVISSQSSYEQRSSISLISTAVCIQEPTALSSLGHVSASESFEEMEVTIDDEDKTLKNRLCDLDSDMENVVETTELSAPGADDSSDDEIYVPIIPQRSTASELFLECEEEELEPWQKQISHVRVKKEKDDGEFSNDQIDCKPKLSPLQRNALRSNTEFIGSLGVQCHAGNSITIVPVAPQQLFQKMVTPKVKEEAYDPISNPVSLSSVQSPVVYAPSSNQLLSGQSNS
ncbi:uncharacterized protein LOC104924300 isoform X2 [Larimichthys crocea]|uniref:uncharacterized protein LOC104924300 isoform X2 n=1 Tax=Larimichthys crocea TaxID=215358 RepID=UPI000F5D7CEA|nr:uncharacterized protein LOC104924300 isoform X2 [Larimichthys crocea]